MTSCQLSQPTFDECHAGLAQALATIPEESFFAYTDACEPADFAAAVPACAPGWFTATVGFAGPFSGRVDLALPEALARDLWAALVGAESPDELEPRAVSDFAGEFANMVCGCWLSQAYNGATFDLTPPAVVTSPAPGPEGCASGVIHLFVNQSPVRLTVTWVERVQ